MNEMANPDRLESVTEHLIFNRSIGEREANLITEMNSLLTELDRRPHNSGSRLHALS